MMYSLLLTIAVAAPGNAEVVTDAQKFSGTIRVADGEVIVDQDGKTQHIPLKQARTITPIPQPKLEPGLPEVWVQLSGGSSFTGTSFVLKGQTASVSLMDNTSLPVVAKVIAFVRFSAANPQLDTQWRDLVQADRGGDTLVLRRPNNQLDSLEGVVTAVSDDSVTFGFEGDVIPVDRSRIDGIIFFHGPTEASQPPICELTSMHGHKWKLAELLFDGSNCQGTTVSGISISIPFSAVYGVKFSRDDAVYLSDLEVADFLCRPFIALPQLSDELAEQEQPRFDRGFGSKALRVWTDESGGSPADYQKGLALTSYTEISFRTRAKYRQFISTVGIDAAYRNQGDVLLTIVGDEKTLWEDPISGQQPAKEIRVDLSGVKRLTIRVDFGEGMDVGDFLNLCNARLIK